MEKFIKQAPEAYRQDLHQFVVLDIVQSWMLLVSEMGFEGKIFDESEITVLEDDLEAVKSHSSSRGIVDRFDFGDSDDPSSGPIAIFDHVNDFLVLLSSKPDLLASITAVPHKVETQKPKKEKKEKEKKETPKDKLQGFLGIRSRSPSPSVTSGNEKTIDLAAELRKDDDGQSKTSKGGQKKIKLKMGFNKKKD